MGALDAIARFFTRAANTLARGARVGAVAPPPLWFSNVRVGGELTPEEVAEIIRQADIGYLYRIVDLARECREKDCHLHACLSTFEESLAGMEVQIIPASDKARDRRIAEFVEGFLSNFGPWEEDDQALALPDLIKHFAGGYYYGHAVAEIIWRKVNGQLIPIAAEPVMPRRFVYDPDTSKLHFWDYAGPYSYPGINLQEAFPNRFMQFQPRVLGTGPSREGLMRPVIWASLLRSWGIRDWMALAELAGKPWRLGIYDKGDFASDEDIRALERALDYLTTNGATMLPSTVEMKVEWPQAKGGAHDQMHQALCEFMAAEMSKAILGQTMTTDNGSSRSQAQVHNEVRKDRRDAAARAIAAVVRWQLVARAVRLNFGADAAIPHVILAPTDHDVGQLADLLVKLAGPKGIGLPLSSRWIYKLIGAPVPKPGEDVVGRAFLPRVPTDEERAAMESASQAAAEGEGEKAKLRIFTPKIRVRLLDGDAEERRAALAELEAAAAEELQRSSARRGAGRIWTP